MNDIIDDLNNGPETDWSIPYYDNMTEEQQKGSQTQSDCSFVRPLSWNGNTIRKQSVCSMLPLTVSLRAFSFYPPLSGSIRH